MSPVFPRVQILLSGFAVLFSSATWGDQPAQSPPPHVLMIAIDDLNDWVGCLAGHPDTKTPHIDRLAQTGVLFRNAHCQAPICNPSRTSVMYGLRPTTSGVYANSPKPWTVARLKNRETMPRFLARHGYQTYTTGKIYHGSGLPEGDFDVVGPRPGQRLRLDQRIVPSTPNGAKGLWDFGGQDYSLEQFQDQQDATWAIEQIKQHLANSNQPFFMAVGFYRPHVPFYSPTEFLDRFPIDQVDLPVTNPEDRDDLPPIVAQITKPPAAPSHDWFVRTNNWREAVRCYLACVHWTDHQVGRLLDALDSFQITDRTIIVLYSDHGFFLGEKQRWAKQALWERATRVPFIVAAPEKMDIGETNQPVELLSLYPTLAELCGLPQPGDLDGTSLRPLLRDRSAQWERVALTTHGKGNHSIRTKTERYIRYRDGSEEFYDLAEDPHEWKNLADQPKYRSRMDELAKHIPEIEASPAKADKTTPKKAVRQPNRKQPNKKRS